jgi:hypothetical protein
MRTIEIKGSIDITTKEGYIRGFDGIGSITIKYIDGKLFIGDQKTTFENFIKLLLEE